MVPTSSKVLHSTNPWGVRLAPGALAEASHLPDNERRSLYLVCDLLEAMGGDWAPESWCGHVTAATRQSLKHQRDVGLTSHYLTGRLVRARRLPGDSCLAYTLTPAGVDVLASDRPPRMGRQEPTRAPRHDQAAHHLLTIEAAIDYLEVTGGDFVRLLGDEDLRSHSRRGRKTEKESLPDGQLWYHIPGQTSPLNQLIEVIVGKYSDDMIRGKVEGLAGQHVLFAAPTASATTRTYRQTGQVVARILCSRIVPGQGALPLPPDLKA